MLWYTFLDTDGIILYDIICYSYLYNIVLKFIYQNNNKFYIHKDIFLSSLFANEWLSFLYGDFNFNLLHLEQRLKYNY